MGFTDQTVKTFPGKPYFKKGTLTVADGRQEFNINVELEREDNKAVLVGFIIWNVSASVEDPEPNPIIEVALTEDAPATAVLTVAPDRDAKGVDFHVEEYQRSIWLEASGADCDFEIYAAFEIAPR